ncbi:integrin alpha [bacterium]|nr:integrin alpha [bacterium]
MNIRPNSSTYPRALVVAFLFFLLQGLGQAQSLTLPIFTDRSTPINSSFTGLELLGDTNGDGYGDILLGVREATTPTTTTYTVQIVDGAHPTERIVLQQWQAQDRFGEGLEVIGDVNGDSVADFAVGAPGYDAGGTAFFRQGRVGVFSGSDGSQIFLLDGPPNQDTSFGAAIIALGDVNQNQTPDFLVSAPELRTTGGFQLFDGGTGALISNLGGFPLGEFGPFGPIPDQDNDLIDDYALYFCPGSTCTIKFYSSNSGNFISQVQVTTNANALVIDTSADYTGDGVRDIAAGFSRFGGFRIGAVEVFSGSTLNSIYALQSPYGTAGSSHFGWALHSLPDSDGDGISELLVGEPYASGTTVQDGGAIHIYSGASGTLISSLEGNTPQENMGNFVKGGAKISQEVPAAPNDANIISLGGGSFPAIPLHFRGINLSSSAKPYSAAGTVCWSGLPPANPLPGFSGVSGAIPFAIGSTTTLSLAGPPNGSGLLFLSAPPEVPLPFAGYPGCYSYVNQSNSAILGTPLLDASGAATFPLTLPFDPLLIGENLRLQFVAADPLGNVGVSEGLTFQIQ